MGAKPKLKKVGLPVAASVDLKSKDNSERLRENLKIFRENKLGLKKEGNSSRTSEK